MFTKCGPDLRLRYDFRNKINAEIRSKNRLCGRMWGRIMIFWGEILLKWVKVGIFGMCVFNIPCVV